jgi:sugar lactone lactonase YvrE
MLTTRNEVLALMLPLAALLVFVACEPGSTDMEPAVPRTSRATEVDGVATGWSTEARFVRGLGGFQGPESVKYDAEQDVFFISNQTGAGSAKDGNGYIARVSASDPDKSSVFVESGRNGAVLDSPKGITLHGDTLWTADIDKLRAFDRHTGAPLATIDFAPVGAVQLNDLMIAPDGSIRVTDTGIIMGRDGVVHQGPDRIFSVGPGAAIRIVVEDNALQMPNGIAWDSAGRRWIVVSFAPYLGQILAMPESGSTRQVLHRSAWGNFDGVEVLPNGTILYASWRDSAVHVLEQGRERRLVSQVPEPADIGIDTRRNRLAIPLATLGQVQLWDLGKLGRVRKNE